MGRGQSLGNLATQVIGFRGVNSTGGVTVVNKTSNAELLEGYRISLGVLGIITEVTITTQPLTYLKRTTQVINSSSSLTEMYSNIYDLCNQYECMMAWGPHMRWDNATSSWSLDTQMSVTHWEETNITNVNNYSSNYCANGCGDCL